MRKFNLTAFFMILLCAAVSGMVSGCGKQEDSSAEGRLELLNVSYDPTREFYAEYNELFENYWNTVPWRVGIPGTFRDRRK